jgi:hypothetical protein
MAFLATPFVIVKTLRVGIFFDLTAKTVGVLRCNTEITLIWNRFCPELDFYVAMQHFSRVQFMKGNLRPMPKH